MKLLYRAEKYADEGIADYISRLAFFNGYKTSAQFTRKLVDYYDNEFGNIPPGFIEGRELLDFEHYKGAQKLYKARLAIEQIFKRMFDKSQLHYAKCIGKNALRKPMMCEKCWKSEPYIRAYWYISQYVRCHVHDSELKPFSSYGNESVAESECAKGVLSPVLKKSVERSTGKSDMLARIVCDMEIYAYEIQLIDWIDQFGRKANFGKLRVEETKSMSDSGLLVGLSIEERMTKIFQCLSIPGTGTHNVLPIVTALRCMTYPFEGIQPKYGYWPRSFYDWADEFLMSDEDLLFSILSFGKYPSTPAHPKYFHIGEILPVFVGLNRHSSEYLLEMLSETLFPYPYPGDYIDADVSKYRRSVKEYRFQGEGVEFITYKDYLQRNDIELV